MNLKRFATSFRIAAALMMSCAALPVFAASNPWNATWQLNTAKSVVPGPDFVMSQTADGAYQMEKANTKYTFRCDGKDYPIKGRSSMSCTQSKPTEMDVFLKEDGVTTNVEHHVIAKDGKTETVVTILHANPTVAPNIPGYAASGEREMHTQVFERISDSTGLLGAWKVYGKGDGAVILQTSITSSTFEMNYPDKKQDTIFKLDGTDSPMRGMPPGGTLSIKAAGPLQMQSTTKVKGTVVIEGTYTVSEDGKTLTEEWWRPDRPMQKGHRVYDKQ